MAIGNPYEPVVDSAPSDQQGSAWTRFLIGCAFGFLPPALYGAYSFHQFQVYVASTPPDVFVCGNPALGSLSLIIFVAPFTGFVAGLATVIIGR